MKLLGQEPMPICNASTSGSNVTSYAINLKLRMTKGHTDNQQWSQGPSPDVPVPAVNYQAIGFSSGWQNP